MELQALVAEIQHNCMVRDFPTGGYPILKYLGACVGTWAKWESLASQYHAGRSRTTRMAVVEQ